MTSLITADGVVVDIISASVSHSSGDQFWRADIRLRDAVAYSLLEDDSLVTLTLAIVGTPTRSWSLMVDTRSAQGNGVNAPTYTVNLLSPTATLAQPRAVLRDWTWDTDTTANAVANFATGETITWNLLDWSVSKENLVYTGASPLDVAVALVQAVGGVLETDNTGTLVARHKYPIKSPQWETAAVDLDLNEAYAVLSQDVNKPADKLWNQITIRNTPVRQDEAISVEIDDERTTTKYAGSTVYFKVYSTANVTVGTPILSTGSLVYSPPSSSNETEFVTFDGVNESSLSKFCSSVSSVLWIGTNLGTITVGSDGRKLTSTSVGVAVARITYTSYATGFGVLFPLSVAGLTEYKALVRVPGTINERTYGTAETTYTRDGGGILAPDIVEALLTNELTRLSRAQQEIDDGERYKEVTLTVTPMLTETICGNLVRFENLVENTIDVGMVTAISHMVTVSPPRATTTVTLKVLE